MGAWQSWRLLACHRQRSEPVREQNRLWLASPSIRHCVSPNEVQAPILILIGDADTWEPVSLCRQMGEHPRIRLEVYSGAYHGFDIPGADYVMLGYRIRHSPHDEAAAIGAVKALIGGLAP